jgi:hypothetical protein
LTWRNSFKQSLGLPSSLSGGTLERLFLSMETWSLEAERRTKQKISMRFGAEKDEKEYEQLV